MFGAPSDVPLVGCRALIALVSYVQWLQGAGGGLSIPHRARGCQATGVGASSAPVVFAGPTLSLVCKGGDAPSGGSPPLYRALRRERKEREKGISSIIDTWKVFA